MARVAAAHQERSFRIIGERLRRKPGLRYAGFRNWFSTIRGASYRIKGSIPRIRVAPCHSERRGGRFVRHATTELAGRGVAVRANRAADLSLAGRAAGHHDSSDSGRAPFASPSGPCIHQYSRLGDRPAACAVRKPAVDRRPILDAVSVAVHSVPGARGALARSNALAHRRIDCSRRRNIHQRGLAVPGDSVSPRAGATGSTPPISGSATFWSA